MSQANVMLPPLKRVDKMFIVELDHNFYIASMGPTSFKERARKYKTLIKAI